MLVAKILTACADLTDQLSGFFRGEYDLCYAQCTDEPQKSDCHLVIIGSDQFDNETNGTVTKTVSYYESEGIPVFLAWVDGNADFRALALQSGCSDYLAPPLLPSVVNAKCKTYMSLANLKKSFVSGKYNATEYFQDIDEELSGLKETIHVQDAAILCLATIARIRDHSTGNHILRTQHYVKALAEYLRKGPEYGDQLDAKTIELFYKTSALHDIGKVGIPDRILQKPDELTAEEFDVMKTHTELGYQAVHSAEQLIKHGSSKKTMKFLEIAKQVTLSHHERWDGKGYPQGLKGKEIPLVARLMAVADVYDAMISRRSYKSPMDHEYVRSTIARGSGNHFDPIIVSAFLDLEAMFERISLTLEDAFPSSTDMTLHAIADLITENAKEENVQE